MLDETATHFTAAKRDDGSFFITLYRYREGWPSYGETSCSCTTEMRMRGSSCHYCRNKRMGMRPQYKGPMGWKFHSSDPDPTPDKLIEIEHLFDVTGDTIDGSIFNPKNMYAAL